VTGYCTQYMGLMTECGDDATTTRDGFPYCDRHARTWDALVKAEAEMVELEKQAWPFTRQEKPNDE
jgi:hypothetical protein